jgi:hypothetical protein
VATTAGVAATAGAATIALALPADSAGLATGAADVMRPLVVAAAVMRPLDAAVAPARPLLLVGRRDAAGLRTLFLLGMGVWERVRSRPTLRC